jgi:hypothetical protein
MGPAKIVSLQASKVGDADSNDHHHPGSFQDLNLGIGPSLPLDSNLDTKQDLNVWVLS